MEARPAPAPSAPGPARGWSASSLPRPPAPADACAASPPRRVRVRASRHAAPPSPALTRTAGGRPGFLDGAAVAIRHIARQQPGDDRLQPNRTPVVEQRRRTPRLDALLQPAGVGSLKRLDAAHHLVQQDADRPEIRLRIDVAGFEPLGRQVGDAAEVVARHLPAERQRLGDPEVEDLDARRPQARGCSAASGRRGAASRSVPPSIVTLRSRAPLRGIRTAESATCRPHVPAPTVRRR